MLGLILLTALIVFNVNDILITIIALSIHGVSDILIGVANQAWQLYTSELLIYSVIVCSGYNEREYLIRIVVSYN